MADLDFIKLTIDGNSYKIPDASATQKGLMSSQHFSKVEALPENAEENKIDSVKVNGTALAIASKVVDIIIKESEENGKLNVAGVDIAIKGLAALAYKAKVSQDDLEDALAALIGKISTNESALTTLQGTGTGSIKKQIDDALNTFAEYTTENDKVDTLKELIDWVASHGSEAGQITKEIQAIQAILKGIGGESEPATIAAYVTAEINKLDLDNTYVKKENGKVLSSNDFTNTLKQKLDGITEGATKVTYSYDGDSKTLSLNGLVQAQN